MMHLCKCKRLEQKKRLGAIARKEYEPIAQRLAEIERNQGLITETAEYAANTADNNRSLIQDSRTRGGRGR